MQRSMRKDQSSAAGTGTGPPRRIRSLTQRQQSKRRMQRPPTVLNPVYPDKVRMESVTSTDEDIIRNHQFIRGVLTGRFKVPGADQTGAHDGEYDTIPPIELLQSAMEQDFRKIATKPSFHSARRTVCLNYTESLRGGAKSTLAATLSRGPFQALSPLSNEAVEKRPMHLARLPTQKAHTSQLGKKGKFAVSTQRGKNSNVYVPQNIKTVSPTRGVPPRPTKRVSTPVMMQAHKDDTREQCPDCASSRVGGGYLRMGHALDGKAICRTCGQALDYDLVTMTRLGRGRMTMTAAEEKALLDEARRQKERLRRQRELDRKSATTVADIMNDISNDVHDVDMARLQLRLNVFRRFAIVEALREDVVTRKCAKFEQLLDGHANETDEQRTAHVRACHKLTRLRGETADECAQRVQALQARYPRETDEDFLFRLKLLHPRRKNETDSQWNKRLKNAMANAPDSSMLVWIFRVNRIPANHRRKGWAFVQQVVLHRVRTMAQWFQVAEEYKVRRHRRAKTRWDTGRRHIRAKSKWERLKEFIPEALAHRREAGLITERESRALLTLSKLRLEKQTNEADVAPFDDPLEGLARPRKGSKLCLFGSTISDDGSQQVVEEDAQQLEPEPEVAGADDDAAARAAGALAVAMNKRTGKFKARLRKLPKDWYVGKDGHDAKTGSFQMDSRLRQRLLDKCRAHLGFAVTKVQSINAFMSSMTLVDDEAKPLFLSIFESCDPENTGRLGAQALANALAMVTDTDKLQWLESGMIIDAMSAVVANHMGAGEDVKGVTLDEFEVLASMAVNNKVRNSKPQSPAATETGTGVRPRRYSLGGPAPYALSPAQEAARLKDPTSTVKAAAAKFRERTEQKRTKMPGRKVLSEIQTAKRLYYVCDMDQNGKVPVDSIMHEMAAANFTTQQINGIKEAILDKGKHTLSFLEFLGFAPLFTALHAAILSNLFGAAAL